MGVSKAKKKVSFTEEETKWLIRYKPGLEALMRGEREPKTEAQKRFIQVCMGSLNAESDAEKLWLRYLESRRPAPKRRTRKKEVTPCKRKTRPRSESRFPSCTTRGSLIDPEVIRANKERRPGTLRSGRGYEAPSDRPQEDYPKIYADPGFGGTREAWKAMRRGYKRRH